MLRLSCDVSALPADGAALDALARLRLAARRAGLELELCNASDDLCCLIRFCGLEEVLRVEFQREPEEREQRLDVQEERELGDPAA
jgi:anti-anti-sigma regulatory factor